MFKHLKIGLFSASVLALTAGTALADFELNILHINDLHSRIEAISKSDSTCSAEDAAANECFGGIARVKTAIDARRAELSGKNVLTLDAGDQFQGSLFYTTYKSAPIADFMNGIGFDAMAIGNHEFDDGPEELAKFIDAKTDAEALAVKTDCAAAMPRPLVALITSISMPMRPRVVMVASIMVECGSFSMLVRRPLRLARFCMMEPTHSSGTSIQTVS